MIIVLGPARSSARSRPDPPYRCRHMSARSARMSGAGFRPSDRAGRQDGLIGQNAVDQEGRQEQSGKDDRQPECRVAQQPSPEHGCYSQCCARYGAAGRRRLVDLGPQPADVGFYYARLGVESESPQTFSSSMVRVYDAALVAHQHFKLSKLARLKFDLLAIAPHGAPGHIEFDVSNAQRGPFRSARRRRPAR